MKQHIGLAFIFVTFLPVHAANTHGKHDASKTEKHPGEHAVQLDARVLIPFPDAIKPLFLATMRQNLADISEIQRAVAESDFDRAIRIAENGLGLGGIKTHDALAQHMPAEMGALGMEFHKASSELAVSLKEKDATKIFAQMARVTDVCVMCHATYRVN